MAKKLSLFLLVGALLTAPVGAYANEQTRAQFEQFKPMILAPTQGIEWASQCLEQYPEIAWLANAEVRATEEGRATANGSYSEQLFGKKFIEFDRTLMTLYCLRLILNGREKAYQEFTAAQPKEERLTRTSFAMLHAQGKALLQSHYEELSEQEMAQAMEAALVLGDLGKSESAREVFKPYGAKAPDHDDFHGELMQILDQYPSLCPTFDRLPSAAKKMLGQTANLTHYGHVAHLEGGPGMFSKLKQTQLSSTALAFDFFVHICDVAGALGHVNNLSSLSYTELTYRAKQEVFAASNLLTDSKKTEMDAYNAYLQKRAEWLGLDANDRTDRALTRMGAMLRLFTPQEGALLKQSILQLDPVQREKIIEQLDTREGEDFTRTPTYMPAVLVGLLNNPLLGNSKEERLSQAIILGMPFLARVLEAHRQDLAAHRADAEIPLNFNKAAGVAKASPTALLNGFIIDAEGDVCILRD